MAAGAATISRGAGRISRRLDRLSERQFALLVSIPGLVLLAAIVLPPILSVFGLSLFRIELAKDTIVRFVGNVKAPGLFKAARLVSAVGSSWPTIQILSAAVPLALLVLRRWRHLLDHNGDALCRELDARSILGDVAVNHVTVEWTGQA